MPKFKAGDRVAVISVTGRGKYEIGDTGTVLEENDIPRIRFDRNIGGHNCGGLCESGHGWAVYEDRLTLVEATRSGAINLSGAA